MKLNDKLIGQLQFRFSDHITGKTYGCAMHTDYMFKGDPSIIYLDNVYELNKLIDSLSDLKKYIYSGWGCKC